MFKFTTPVAGKITKVFFDADPADFELAGKGFTIKPSNVDITSPLKGKVTSSDSKKIIILSKTGLAVAVSASSILNIPTVGTKVKVGTSIGKLENNNSINVIVTSGHSFDFEKKEVVDGEIISE